MLSPNHRILIVDDNPAIHADFRKILCPARPGNSEVQDLKSALFDKAPAATATEFELVSAFQGQEALELVKQALAEGRPPVCGDQRQGRGSGLHRSRSAAGVW